MRSFWIDTDTASDDAVALVMALRHPNIDVVGISVVAGNVPLDRGVQNALYTRQLCERDDVPIYAGAAAPLMLKLSTAQNVHGHDGMGDIGLALSGRNASQDDAVDALIEASHIHAGELTLVTLGPLTNIAIAVERDPSLLGRLQEVVVMGAVTDHIGNVNPVAEFNMWADPHSVKRLFDAGFSPLFVGWDISRKYAVVRPEQADELRAIGTRLAEFCVDIQRIVAEFCASETHLDGYDLPDPIAMAVAIDSTVATRVESYYCEVETESPVTRGMVVVDSFGLLHRPANARFVVEADNNRFLEMVKAAVS